MLALLKMTLKQQFGNDVAEGLPPPVGARAITGEGIICSLTHSFIYSFTHEYLMKTFYLPDLVEVLDIQL